jgi:hypothetical protein
MNVWPPLRKPIFSLLALLSLLLLPITAIWALSYEEAEKAYQRRDFDAALSMLRTLAEKDDGKAQYSLSLMLAKGEGTAANLVEAFVWASLAVENAPDEYFSARSSILLERVEKRLPKDQLTRAKEELAGKKAKLADKKANPDRVDWEVTQMSFRMGNYAEALGEAKKLAEQNDPRAIFFLGDIYRRGEGVSVDPAEAAKWFRQGVDQGFPDCMTALANLYHAGQGVPQDHPEAIKLFFQAAELGYAEAQERTAEWLSIGRGTDKNLVEALKWAILAAEQGRDGAETLMRSLLGILPEPQAEKAREEAQLWHQKTGK